MDILSLGGSGLLGGLFGAVASGLGRIVGIYEMREKRQDRTLEMAHEKDQWAHELDLQSLQIKARTEETESEFKLAQTQGSWTGLASSVTADGALPASYRWVDAVRALTRPILTVLIWAVFTVLFFASLTARLPAATGASLTVSFIDSVTFAASTALAWWFGDRRPRSLS